MPGRLRLPCIPRGHENIEQRQGCRRLRAEVDDRGQEHARVHEHVPQRYAVRHRGHRSRSSSTRAATSTFGRADGFAVGLAMSRRPTRRRRGGGTSRTRRTEASSSMTISSSVPGVQPARRRISDGTTMRPALSMAVFMSGAYHGICHIDAMTFFPAGPALSEGRPQNRRPSGPLRAPGGDTSAPYASPPKPTSRAPPARPSSPRWRRRWGR